MCIHKQLFFYAQKSKTSQILSYMTGLWPNSQTCFNTACLCHKVFIYFPNFIKLQPEQPMQDWIIALENDKIYLIQLLYAISNLYIRKILMTARILSKISLPHLSDWNCRNCSITACEHNRRHFFFGVHQTFVYSSSHLLTYIHALI